MRKLNLTLLSICLSTMAMAQTVSTIVPLTEFSSRAIDFHEEKLLFGANQARFGFYDTKTKQHQLFTIEGISNKTEFRAVSASSSGYYILSAGSPALLYKVELDGTYQEVYRDDNPKAFYNSMKRIDAQTFIAIGDQIDDCVSILMSVDGGKSWQRKTCADLPKFQTGEGAFAASNTNIVVKENAVWIAMGVNSSRVLKTMDKGKTWTVSQTGVVNQAKTQGIYSMDFYDQNQGVVWGGDYTQPKEDHTVASVTQDGGKTWQPLTNTKEIGYRSAVQYVPNSKAKAMIVTGFAGVDYTTDKGKTWQRISDKSFYALRFINPHLAYLIGKDGIGILELKP